MEILFKGSDFQIRKIEEEILEMDSGDGYTTL